MLGHACPINMEETHTNIQIADSNRNLFGATHIINNLTTSDLQRDRDHQRETEIMTNRHIDTKEKY